MFRYEGVVAHVPLMRPGHICIIVWEAHHIWYINVSIHP
jgi:hypothetical protein